MNTLANNSVSVAMKNYHTPSRIVLLVLLAIIFVPVILVSGLRALGFGEVPVILIGLGIMTFINASRLSHLKATAFTWAIITLGALNLLTILGGWYAT